MKKLLIISAVIATFVSCKNNTEVTPPKVDAEVTTDLNPTSEKTAQQSSPTFTLLQGTWRNVNDPLSTLVFEGNTTKNYYDGIDTGSLITFSIGDTCENGANPTGSEEKDKYISTSGKAFECYYIVALDQQNLELSFLGRGNTLSFKRE